MTQPQRLAESPPQRCPTCGNAEVVRVALTDLAVYLRCAECGHVWTFADRRETRRPTDPKRF